MTKSAHPTDAGRAEHTPGRTWIVSGEVREVAMSNGKKHQLYCADIIPAGYDPKGWRGFIASIQSADHIANGFTREEAKSHARLIAAAPDLLKALERITELSKPGQTVTVSVATDIICDIWNEASAALATAKGDAE